MYSNGLTQAAIARELGVTSSTINNYIMKMGLFRESQELDLGKLFALHRAGWSVQKIAFDLKVPEKLIESKLKGAIFEQAIKS